MIYIFPTTFLNIHNSISSLFFHMWGDVSLFQIYVYFPTAVSQFYKLNFIYESFSIFIRFFFTFTILLSIFLISLLNEFHKNFLFFLFLLYWIHIIKTNFWCLLFFLYILHNFCVMFVILFAACWCQKMNISNRFLVNTFQSTHIIQFMLHVIVKRTSVCIWEAMDLFDRNKCCYKFSFLNV